MNGDRDIVAESMVVENIDAEEQDNVDEPSADGHLVWGQEEWRARLFELSHVACNGHEKKLYEREKNAFQNQLVEIIIEV